MAAYFRPHASIKSLPSDKLLPPFLTSVTWSSDGLWVFFVITHWLLSHVFSLSCFPSHHPSRSLNPFSLTPHLSPFPPSLVLSYHPFHLPSLSISVSLFFHVSLCLCLCLSLFVSVYLSLSVCLPLFLSLSLSLPPSAPPGGKHPVCDLGHLARVPAAGGPRGGVSSVCHPPRGAGGPAGRPHRGTPHLQRARRGGLLLLRHLKERLLRVKIPDTRTDTHSDLDTMTVGETPQAEIRTWQPWGFV